MKDLLVVHNPLYITPITSYCDCKIHTLNVLSFHFQLLDLVVVFDC